MIRLLAIGGLVVNVANTAVHVSVLLTPSYHSGLLMGASVALPMIYGICASILHTFYEGPEQLPIESI